MESTFQRIIRKTGRKPISCKCQLCKQQCQTPCQGTPEDIEKIIDAGFGTSIKETGWGAGIIMGVTNELVIMAQPEMTNNGCVFFKDGLCSLHNSGLKPTEGKLSHHSTRIDNFNPKKSLGWAVAKEWINVENKEAVKRISEKLSKINNHGK